MSGINEVADFCSWYVSDMPRWQVEVCFGEKSGRRLLASVLLTLTPERTSRARPAAIRGRKRFTRYQAEAGLSV
jgi:hypothetical protein